MLTFIDEFSRKAWVYVLQDKAEVPKTTIQILKYIKNNFQYKAKYFQTDNGKEYKNKKVENYCKNNGIMKIYSPPYNPQNNGKVERFNYTIIDCAKTILNWSKLDIRFWDFAVMYATYLYNIITHKGIANLIPNEVFFNSKVNLKYVKAFGCIAYYKNFS